MKRILFLACFSAVIVIGGIAFQWPVEPGRLERNFGSSVPAFQRGISFKAAEGPVLAPHKGELVFAADGGNLPNGFPLPQGSIAAIAHDAGIISVITGIQTGSLASYRGVVEQGETIGLSPPASAGRSLLFYLYDSREKR